MLIDGVFSGGGIKDFALIGAYQVLEEKGFRFHRLAGTSAGAILAGFIAAGFSGKEIERLLDEQDFTIFLDPRNTFLPFPIMKWLFLYWRMGLYRGKALEDWLTEKLASKGIYSFGDLPDGSLKLIASDITNGKMLVLPDDLERHGISGRTFPIARAIRMSCGIPFFFEPVKLNVGFGESLIVDGGVLSNFPIWLFDEPNGKKQRPVIGLKISRGNHETPVHIIKNSLNLFEALFSTMQNAHDSRYISRKHEKNIIFIPVEDTKTTDFDLSNDTKIALMEQGRKSTDKFLKTWSPLSIQTSGQSVY